MSNSSHPDTIEELKTLPHAEHKLDVASAKMGMWLFLLTELLLFGGLFVIYATYRYLNQEAFHHAAMELNVFIGTLNTVILLTSSLTAALSITALRLGNRVLSIIMLASTIILAFIFLVNKYFEWAEKFHHGIFPGSEDLINRPPGQILFFGLYYSMTGLHALHVLAGMIILAFVLVFIWRNKVTSTDYAKLENGALYWHLVDIIWIFLFPLFYLIK